MKLGNFFCERCGKEYDEEEHLKAPKRPCVDCGNTVFRRKPSFGIHGRGAGWVGRSQMWDAAIGGLHEQSLQAGMERKKKGDRQRAEKGLGEYNVRRNIH